jgi:hypothetical protein
VYPVKQERHEHAIPNRRKASLHVLAHNAYFQFETLRLWRARRVSVQPISQGRREQLVPIISETSSMVCTCVPRQTPEQHEQAIPNKCKASLHAFETQYPLQARCKPQHGLRLWQAKIVPMQPINQGWCEQLATGRHWQHGVFMCTPLNKSGTSKQYQTSARLLNMSWDTMPILNSKLCGFGGHCECLCSPSAKGGVSNWSQL